MGLEVGAEGVSIDEGAVSIPLVSFHLLQIRMVISVPIPWFPYPCVYDVVVILSNLKHALAAPVHCPSQNDNVPAGTYLNKKATEHHRVNDCA